MVGETDYYVKAIILGDYSVGKSTIRNYWLKRTEDMNYLYAIGSDFASVDRTIDEINIRIQIWDNVGHVNVHQIRPVYYKGAFGAIVVYDISNPQSFNSVLSWVETYWSLNGRGVLPVLIIGNKSDLKSRLSVPTEHINQLCQSWDNRTKPLGFTVTAIESSKLDRQSLNIGLDALCRDIIAYISDKRHLH